MTALLPLAQKRWPGVVRFADEDDICKTFERLGFDGGHWPPDNRHHATRSTLFENFDQPAPLNAHPRQADEVCTAETLEINIFDVLIDQSHLVAVGDQSGK